MKRLLLSFVLLTLSAMGQTTANLWVDTNGGSCTRNSTPAAYVDGAACSSINSAYAAAAAGDTIRVRAGSYGAQNVNFRTLGSPSSIVNIIADGGTVTISGDLVLDCQYCTMDGVTDKAGFTMTGVFQVGANYQADGTPSCAKSYPSGGWPCQFRNKNVTLKNFRANHGGFITGDTVLVQHGLIPSFDVCGSGGEDGIQVLGLGSGVDSTWTPSINVTIDDMTIGPLTNYLSCGAHDDSIQGFGYRHLTVRNSHFLGAGTCILAYSFDNANPGQVDSIRIENNAFTGNFDQSHCISIGNDQSVSCGSSNLNNVIQNNTFTNGGGVIADVNCAGSPDGIFRNNIVATGGSACWGGSPIDWQYDYNVYPVGGGGGCSTTAHAKVCNPSFVDATHANGNVDLSSSDTCAKDYVPTAAGTYPTADIHGTARPQGAAVDAGAFEYASGGASGPNPPTSVTVTVQ